MLVAETTTQHFEVVATAAQLGSPISISLEYQRDPRLQPVKLRIPFAHLSEMISALEAARDELDPTPRLQPGYDSSCPF